MATARCTEEQVPPPLWAGAELPGHKVVLQGPGRDEKSGVRRVLGQDWMGLLLWDPLATQGHGYEAPRRGGGGGAEDAVCASPGTTATLSPTSSLQACFPSRPAVP